VNEFLRTRRWANVFSIRALIGSALISLIPGILLGLVAPVLFWAGLVPTFIAWHLLVQMAPGRGLYCQFCHKRVKMNATHCHHCGQQVVP
jgi:hypothetical protein